MSSVVLGNEFVLMGGTVISGESLSLLSPGYVAVRHGVIIAVGEGRPPQDLPMVDITNRLVVPGMINCHTHMEDAALKELAFGAPTDANLFFEPDGLRHVKMAELPPAELVAGMRRAAQQMLASGTVAVADYRTGGAAGVAAVRQACQGLPLRCLIFGGHSLYPLQADHVLKENRDGLSSSQLAEIADTIELADGFAPVWVNDTTDLALRQIEQIVRQFGKRLSTHSSASPNYREISLLRTGKSDITRVVDFLRPDFVVHMTVATDEEIERIAQADIPIVVCARSMASLGRTIPPYVVALSKGAVVGLGTDNVMMSSPDLLAEMDFLGRATRSVMGDPAALDPRTLLASVTTDAARVLGLDHELGSIAPGRFASMVMFDMTSSNLSDSVNPIASLVERATAADIQAVLVEGKVVHGAL